MKKIIGTIILILICVLAFAQKKPPLPRSVGTQVVSDRALKANQYFNLPSGPTPYFPAFVADSNKCGSLFAVNSTSGGYNKGLYYYNCDSVKWVQYSGFQDPLIVGNITANTGTINHFNIGTGRDFTIDNAGPSNDSVTTYPNTNGANAFLMFKALNNFGTHPDTVQYMTVDSVLSFFSRHLHLSGIGTTTHPLSLSFGFVSQPFTFDGSIPKALKIDSAIFQTVAGRNPAIAAYANSHYYPLSGNPSAFLTANQTITFTPTGDVTGSGSGGTSLTPTLSIGAGKVTNTMLVHSTISGIALGSNLQNLTAGDATLTASGAYNGGVAQNIILNLSNPNHWTGAQTFNTVTLTTALSLPSGSTGVTPLTTDSTTAVETTAGAKALFATGNISFNPNFNGTGLSGSPIYILAPTGPKTSNYTLAPGDVAQFNTTSTTLTATMPNAPPDGTIEGLSLVQGTNTLTSVTAGSDVFYYPSSGVTSVTFTSINSGAKFIYHSGVYYLLDKSGSGASSQWVTAGSNISFAGGNIAVGTTTATYPISVKGAIGLTPLTDPGDATDFKIETLTDEDNTSNSALYIYPTSDGKRMFLGKTGSTIYTLDFTYVQGLANVPAFGTTDGTNYGDPSQSHSIYTTAPNADLELRSTSSTGGNINFYTGNDFSTATLRMQILQGGGVNVVDSLKGKTIAVTGAGGAGVIIIPTQSSTPATPGTGKHAIYTNAAGQFSVMGSNGNAFAISRSLLSTSRVYTLPDSAGTLALESRKIPNSGLVNSSFTINGSSISLGGSATVTANTPNLLTPNYGLSGSAFNGGSALGWVVDTTKVVSLPRLATNLTGYAKLAGNNTFSGSNNYNGITINSSYNYIQYDPTGSHFITVNVPTLVANRSIAWPILAGTLALTSDIPTYTANGGAALSANNFTIDHSFANTWISAKQSVEIDALNTSKSAGFETINTTAATSSQKQISPMFSMIGQGWNNSTSASTSVGIQFYASSANITSSAPVGIFAIRSIIGGTAGSTMFQVDGAGNFQTTATFTTGTYTVSTLPTIAFGSTTLTVGTTAVVTDSLTPGFGLTVVGGGSVVTRVMWNGSNWVCE